MWHRHLWQQRNRGRRYRWRWRGRDLRLPAGRSAQPAVTSFAARTVARISRSAAGLGILDDTSCALFLDLRNSGRQDLVVLRASGPAAVSESRATALSLLRHGRLSLRDARRRAFTGMAAADFDRDGRVDLYLMLATCIFKAKINITYAVAVSRCAERPAQLSVSQSADGGRKRDF